MADLIAASLDHFRLDADYKHALHLAALPTAWVCGFDKSAALRVGSSTAWTSEIPGATAGFLEYSGAAIQYIERALDRVERRMALLGARMPEKGSAEGTAPGLAESQCLSGLADVVRSVNESLTKVLELAYQAIVSSGPGHQPLAISHQLPPISFALNTALEFPRVSGSDLTAVVSAWKEGAISKETMLEYLKRHEVLPDGRTVAQERSLMNQSYARV